MSGSGALPTDQRVGEVVGLVSWRPTASIRSRKVGTGWRSHAKRIERAAGRASADAVSVTGCVGKAPEGKTSSNTGTRVEVSASFAVVAAKTRAHLWRIARLVCGAW